jgi:hypothetical protein
MLHEQVSELGLIAGHDPGRYTRSVREGGRLQNVLHLLPDALEGWQRANSGWYCHQPSAISHRPFQQCEQRALCCDHR